MTDYNDGKWHGWNGGECPVHPKSIVMACFFSGPPSMSDGYGNVGVAAEYYAWDHEDDHEMAENIIAFRVIKEHKEPREFLIRYTGIDQFEICRDGDPSAFLVREVLE